MENTTSEAPVSASPETSPRAEDVVQGSSSTSGLADPPAGSPVFDLHEPPTRLYLAAVATLGVALAWRWYAIAGALDAGARSDRTRRWLWALGVFCPPVAGALLYETGRLARLELMRLGVRPRSRSLWMPPFIYMGIWALVPLMTEVMLAPFVVLLPVPFLMVQGDLNDLERVRAVRESRALQQSKPRRWLALLALPVVACGIYLSDRSALLEARTSRLLTPGETVEDEHRRISFTAADSGWQRVAPGVVGDGEEDMAFRRRGSDEWVMVHIEPQPGADFTLDSLVDTRRQVIREAHTVRTSAEKRHFLPGANLAVASFAHYEVRGVGFAGVFSIVSVILDGHSIEAVGFGSTSRASRQEVQRFVGSLRGGSSLARTTAGKTAKGEAQP